MSKYTSQTSKSTSSLLKDNSWIKKVDNEEDVDLNFGKSVLGRYRSSDTLDGSEADDTKNGQTVSTSTSVNALTKRFSGSQDELRSSTLPSSKTKSSYTKTTYSTMKSELPNTITTSKTSVREEPKTGTTTTTVTKDGKTTTETIITNTQSVRSPVLKSPTKTETFTERVKSSSKGLNSNYSPPSTTKVTETTVTSNKNAEDRFFEQLTPMSKLPVMDSKKTVSSTETVTVKSSGNGSGIKTTTTTKTLSTPEDDLYDTLLPKSITSNLPSDSKTTVSRTETVLEKSSTDTNAEVKLTPPSIKNTFSPVDSKKTVSSTETVTVKSSDNANGIKTTTTTRTSSTADDDLNRTYLSKSITSNMSSPGGGSPTLSSPSSTLRSTSYRTYTDDMPFTRTTSYTISSSSDDYNNDRKSYSYSRPDSSYEYSSITSPSVYSSTSYRSSSSDSLADPIYSKSSTSSVYAAPERTVLEKDLCTVCRKPFTSEAKMVLDDIKINCHASCFKCAVCNNTLGHMKAGDSVWIYKRMVYCESCFEVTRDKWRR